MNVEYFVTLSRYHRWTFERLYDQVDRLSDGQYRQDRGMFFRSIHGTLNHILLVERIWRARFAARSYTVDGLGQELEKERTQLRDAIFEQCGLWEEYTAGLTVTELGKPLRYTNISGQEFEFTLALLLGHVFNHATHHRGQISTALTQAGLEAPVMDLPYYLIDTM